MRSIGSVRWSPKPTSPKNPSFEATPPCYRFRGREPPRDRPQARASRPRAALPFAPNATTIVGLAAVSGVATGFFRPAVYAGLPNLVSDRDLPRANSLLQVIDNSTWAIGSLIGGALVAARGPHLAYWINAATFLISAALIAQIGQRRLQEAKAETRGHWRDLADGFGLVRSSRGLLTVFIAWNVGMVANAFVNVGEPFLAIDTFSAGSFGLGLMMGSAAVGLAGGAFLAGSWIEERGLPNVYGASLGLMALGVAGAAGSPTGSARDGSGEPPRSYPPERRSSGSRWRAEWPSRRRFPRCPSGRLKPSPRSRRRAASDGARSSAAPGDSQGTSGGAWNRQAASSVPPICLHSDAPCVLPWRPHALARNARPSPDAALAFGQWLLAASSRGNRLPRASGRGRSGRWHARSRSSRTPIRSRTSSFATSIRRRGAPTRWASRGRRVSASPV